VSKPFRIAELIPKIEELALKHADAESATMAAPSKPSPPPYAI
jgi:hypothetical protein